jgi:CDP-diacylglycerol--serine O-phosphatidyltransferase
MRKHIPNFFTSLNLLSGCIALVFAFDGQLVITAVLIGVGALFDFIDGFAARLLQVKSGIGKELDSLADVITFGLVPGVIVFQLMNLDLNTPGVYVSSYSIFTFLAFIVPVFSALRLAKFNTDTRQEEVFYGLPTPASAIFLGSFPLVLMQENTPVGISLAGIHEMITNFYVLASLTVLVSWLMVSEIRLFSLKFKSFSWEKNKTRYIFLGLGVALLLLLNYVAIPLIVVLYVMLSLAIKDHS